MLETKPEHDIPRCHKTKKFSYRLRQVQQIVNDIRLARGTPLRYYQCDYCNLWHLSHRRKLPSRAQKQIKHARERLLMVKRKGPRKKKSDEDLEEKYYERYYYQH